MTYTAEAVREEMKGHVDSLVSLAIGETRKAALAFAAKVLRLPVPRVKALYYGEARAVPAHEADQIRAYVEAAQKLIEARAQYERTRAEFLGSASPLMARLAPPQMAGAEVPKDQQATVGGAPVKGGRR